MDLLTILKMISIILGILCTSIIPLAFALVRAIKVRSQARTAAEREAANTDMYNVLTSLIIESENLYKGVNDVLKTQGQSAGAVKKDSVLTKLQAYALTKGYDFDPVLWSGKVDEQVDLTRKVNPRKTV